jgi:PqqD family protein of HPr-rel-A system
LAVLPQPASDCTLSSQSKTSDLRWHAASPTDILWTDWSGDFVAYHRPSGKTHLLNAASELLITRILREPKTTSDIVEALATLQQYKIDKGYAEWIGSLLHRLDELGLIEKA